METTTKDQESLPRLAPELAVRLNGLLNRDRDPEDAPRHQATGAEELIRLLLQDAVDRNASDIHFEPFSQGWRVRFRVDGQLHDVARLGHDRGLRAVRHFKTLGELDPVASFLPHNARLRREVLNTTVDLRLASTPCHGGESLHVRILNPNRVRHRIGDLGMNEKDVDHLKSWLDQITGMCLVTGPIGSGKTTTLYALLHELEMSDRAVVTIEDPVEYALDGITQIQVDEDHGLTFAEGLKAMLRMDPDYMLIGEIRDAESARTAIEAASCGHVVMSTLHCPDAAGIITLLRNWSIPDHQIASVVEMVVNQRLVRRLCTKCRRLETPHREDRKWIESLRLPVPDKVYRAVGCKACLQTGYSGRIGVFETWRRDESDYVLILKNVDEHSLRNHLRERGHKTVLDDAFLKATAGITSLAEIRQMGARRMFFRGAAAQENPVSTEPAPAARTRDLPTAS
jgi:type II secretory ATPase GspE/PulE/Tfp pilus assembly ATPase PilB-like protein